MALIAAADVPGSADAKFDVRGPAAFQAGHLPRSYCLTPSEWEDWLKAPGFDDLATWRTRLGAMGFDGSRAAIVYDDGSMTPAARVWMVLSALGVPTRVVNGGWPAVQSLPVIVTKKGFQPAHPVTFNAPASPPPHKVSILNRHVLRDTLAAVQVLDVRTSAEFTGIDRKTNTRVGKLPGAINLDHKQMLEGSGALRDANELQQLISRAGIADQPGIVTMCQGGGRAALAALGAAAAGYKTVGVYYPSFGDWQKDPSCPVEEPKP